MRRILKWVVVLAAVSAVLVLARRYAGAYVTGFTGWVDGLGAWAPVAFITGYALATVAFIPGVLLTLAAGVIFGLLWGAAYVLAGAIIGSTAAFLIARHLAREPVERRVREDRRFDAIDRAVGREGLKIMLLLRLSPVVPYNLLNYALGVTRVRLRDYLVADVAMIPSTVLYVYSGKLAGDLAGVGGVERGWGYYTVLAAGLAATVAVTVMVTRVARKELSKEAPNTFESDG